MTRPKVDSGTVVKKPDAKAQARALKAAKKKAAVAQQAAEVAAAAVAPVAEEDIKVAAHSLSPDQQRRQEARERKQRENEAHVAAGTRTKAAALEQRAPIKTRAKRKRDHVLKVAAIDAYKAQIGGDLDVGLPPLPQGVADFFHRFYTEGEPVHWREFCDNFEALGGVITGNKDSKYIFEWQDPVVPGVTLTKEIHAPHPHYLIGDHYRLHIGRFLNVVRAFRHERMRASLGVVDGKIFDQRTFDEDLIRFWR